MSSRALNTIKNSLFNICNQFLAIVLQFIIRTVFIRCLALEYLGVSGLFSNILSMLSLTELGLGAAIVCSMYKPLADNDHDEINRYFNIYRGVYTIIGCFICGLGLVLLPFLQYLIKDASNIPNLKLLYVLYLSDTVASYFFAHYRSLLSADQKEYVNTNNRSLFLVIQTAAQIVLLYTTHNYILFLSAKIACNILSSYVLSIKVKRRYPYLKTIRVVSLDASALMTLKRDTVGVFSTRIAMTVLNSTDSLIMSAFLGSIVTAYYSNYSLLVGTVGTAMGLIFSSVQASIGNYCVTQTIEDQKKLFFNLNYLYFCIYGFCTVCLFGLISPFVEIWLGESFTLPCVVVVAIVAKFYFGNVRQTVLNFLSVNHLLNKITIKNVIEVVVNLVVSIVLVKRIGIAGIFVGTSIGMLSTSLWFEPVVLFKEHLHGNIWSYFLKTLSYLFVIALGCFAANRVVLLLFNRTIMSFILSTVAVGITAVVSTTIPFLKTNEFSYMLRRIRNAVHFGGDHSEKGM